MLFIFDFDGVIIDSSHAVHAAASVIHTELGVPQVSVEANTRRWLGPSMTESVRSFCEDFGIVDVSHDELAQRFFDAYVQAAPSKTTMFAGIDDLLTELSSGSAPLALATLKARTEMDAMPAPLPGLQYFGVVACPDHHLDPVSKKTLVGEALSMLRELHGDVQEGVMIGDRASDIAAGHAHGLRTVGVTWGGGTSAEMNEAGADDVATTVAELATLLRSF